MQKHRRNKSFKSKYVCQVCKKRFTTKAMKNEHIETEHADAIYKCEFCPKEFTGIQHAEVKSFPILMENCRLIKS